MGLRHRKGGANVTILENRDYISYVSLIFSYSSVQTIAIFEFGFAAMT